jgi:hypothetical protein
LKKPKIFVLEVAIVAIRVSFVHSGRQFAVNVRLNFRNQYTAIASLLFGFVQCVVGSLKKISPGRSVLRNR